MKYGPNPILSYPDPSLVVRMRVRDASSCLKERMYVCVCVKRERENVKKRESECVCVKPRVAKCDQKSKVRLQMKNKLKSII